MTTRIIAEFRGYKGKTVLLERSERGRSKRYRVTVYRMFPTVEEAQKTFLSNVPRCDEEYYTRLINENDNRG